MTALQKRRRGEPLLVLALIGLCWIGVRIATWQTADGKASILPHLPGRPTQVFARAEPSRRSMPPGARASKASPLLPPVWVAADRLAPQGPVITAARAPLPPIAPGLAGGHAMMWLAVVARMPGPEALLEAARLAPPPAILTPPSVPPSPTLARPTERRWSGDAWALVRGGGGGASAAGPGVATYGGNQVGAVLRYRLSPGSPHRPTAYLRASVALGGSAEREGALGLSVRPVAGLPVILAAEGRVGIQSGRAVARPAVMAVTELPPMALPGKTRAELYAQAGYVAGANATPFADGQLRVDRRIVQAGSLELRAGAGAWGGAQRGAARLDVGPSATLGIAQGSAAARIGLDWRFRVAGAAAPATGPALTVSAGF